MNSNNSLNLTWWRIDTNYFRLPKDHGMVDPVALTMIAATRAQTLQINRWCKDNGVYRIKPTCTWEDTYRYRKPGGSISVMIYNNNERSLIAERSVIERMEKWLVTLGRREFEIVVEGVSRDNIKEMVKGHDDVRVLSDILHDDVHLVSLNDPTLRLELMLRCD